MSTLREMAEAIRARESWITSEQRARASLIEYARGLAQANVARAEVCRSDQQPLAQFLRDNAATLRNLANLVEGAKS